MVIMQLIGCKKNSFFLIIIKVFCDKMNILKTKKPGQCPSLYYSILLLNSLRIYTLRFPLMYVEPERLLLNNR